MKVIHWLLLMVVLGGLIAAICLVDFGGSTLLQRWLAPDAPQADAGEQAPPAPVPATTPEEAASDDHTDTERQNLDGLIRSRLEDPPPGKRAP
jgi:hypothetical protein